MSLITPTSPLCGTSVQQKVQAKAAAKNYRYGSPKLRDVLREKCRIRLKEVRISNYDKLRRLDGSSNPKIGLNEILREELAEIEQDIELQAKIYKELLDGLDEWFIEQLEEEEIYLINMIESNELICPLCEKTTLTTINMKEYECSCKASFTFNGNLEMLRSALQSKIDSHEQQCSMQLNFFIEPGSSTDSGNILNAICETCDYFCSL